MPRVLPFVVIVAGVAAPAVAGGVELNARIFKEQRIAAPDGSTEIRMLPAVRAVPGDRLRYVLHYRNGGTEPARDIVIAQPIAAAVQYQGPADGSSAPEVSTDGRRYGPLSTLTVETASGQRPATAADVTHIRWRLAAPVAAGGAGDVAFRAILR